MKELLKKIWTWLKELFSRDDSQSALLKVLMEGLSGDDLDVIKDKELGAKAIQFVKELNERTDLTGSEKAKIFNEKMLAYLKKVGKVVAVFAINLLRELAVTAVKIAVTNAAASLLLADATKVKEKEDDDVQVQTE